MLETLVKKSTAYKMAGDMKLCNEYATKFADLDRRWGKDGEVKGL
jgi:hypothetical protein